MPDAKVKIGFDLNGESVEVAFAPHKTLLEVLREDLGLTGTKHGCELGECGTCAVLVDGKPVLSCLVLGLACAGRRVKTVEGMAVSGKLHPLQDTFAELGAAQCGYCTPAFLLAAEALLAEHPKPSRDEIKQALSQPVPLHGIREDLRGRGIGRGVHAGGAGRAGAGDPVWAPVKRRRSKKRRRSGGPVHRFESSAKRSARSTRRPRSPA